MSSSMLMRRALMIRGLLVFTTICGAAGAAHAATSVRARSTSTRQMRQAPVGEAPCRWQRVGISTPLRWATSRIVSPDVKENSSPLMMIAFSELMTSSPAGC